MCRQQPAGMRSAGNYRVRPGALSNLTGFLSEGCSGSTRCAGHLSITNVRYDHESQDGKSLQCFPFFCYTGDGIGAVAQLGERRVRNAEARGSILHSSTISLLFPPPTSHRFKICPLFPAQGQGHSVTPIPNDGPCRFSGRREALSNRSSRRTNVA